MLDHSMYTQEVRERMTKRQLESICSSEIKTLSERDRVLIETAYRRGFFQGFFSCCKAVGNGFSWKELDKFLHVRLFKWRYSRHGGKFQEPRWIDD